MSKLFYITHKEIDFVKWDQTILNSKAPLVFAQSFYLNATSAGWNALIGEDYKSVFPLTTKSKFGINYLPQPHFTSQLGLFGDFTKEDLNFCLDYIIKKYKLIQIELNHLCNHSATSKCTFVIDYKKPYSFNENTKRNISRAQNNGFKVEEVKDNDAILLSQTYLVPFLKNDLGLNEEAQSVFMILVKNAAKEKKLHTFKVINTNEEVMAIGTFISNGKHTIFLKGTNFDKKENTGSMHLLVSHAIKYFEGKSETFDFAGGSLSAGLAGFYKGLGGEQLNYGYLNINNLPWYIKLFKK